ncbi:MAG TPA: DNA repair protein RadA, partial [Beijerinckiaceae bacterium]|nr:DNA repair protein RadA [Beijerinckiaceae bacterium]
MSKARSRFVCQNCGAVTQRWQGKCESCGDWNTIIEENQSGIGAQASRSARAGRVFA